MNDPAMGASVWLGAVLHRRRHAAGDRAARLPDAAAMTDIVERLRDLPLLYQETGDEAADTIDRLRAFEWAWGQLSADLREFLASEAPEAARRALETKP